MNVQHLKTVIDMLICSIPTHRTLITSKTWCTFHAGYQMSTWNNYSFCDFLIPHAYFALVYKGYIKHICRNCMNWNSILSCIYYFFWLAFRISIKFLYISSFSRRLLSTCSSKCWHSIFMICSKLSTTSFVGRIFKF